MRSKISVLLICILLFSCINTSKNRDFPVFFHQEPKDCGPTCLEMIGAYHNTKLDKNEIIRLSEMDDKGTSFLGLSNAADSLGFRTLGIKASYKQLQEVPLPAIVHWNKNHFVVVYKINSKEVWVVDPSPCLLYTSPSPRDLSTSRMPSSA